VDEESSAPLRSPILNPLSPTTISTMNKRGMPHWREKQRSLPIGEKVELIGRFILETRQLEQVKKSCKPSVMSLNNSPVKAR
jgi:hypothetical protein